MEFLGKCGRAQNECKVVWSSAFSSRVAPYPSDYLPSKLTIWYANTTGGYSFNVSTEDPFGGLVSGAFVSLGSLATYSNIALNPLSKIVLIFAQTENKINVPYKITQENIDTANQNNGIVTIDIGSYPLEFIGVTDYPVEVILEKDLTTTEISDIKKNHDTVDDYLFRKLFELGINEIYDRFVEIVPNEAGIAYRMDNGTDLSDSILGIGTPYDLNQANYKDGTSKLIEINLAKPKADGSFIKVGDIVYLSYVSITKHYFRQLLKVKWALVAQTLGGISQCVVYPNVVKNINFRFFEWTDPVTKETLKGWRATDACNMNPWIAYANTLGVLAVSTQKVYNGKEYVTNSDFSSRQLANFVYRYPSSIRTTEVKSLEQVMFNVHPLALQKPDTEKYGYEKTLADYIVSNGKNAQTPFFDKYGTIVYASSASGNPNVYPLPYDLCDSSNFLISPIKNTAKYTQANAEANCSTANLFSGNGGDDILVSYSISSNVITEQLDKKTRIYVEHFSTQGEKPYKLLSVQSVLGSGVITSCVRLPSNPHTVYLDSNPESYLSYRIFANKDIETSISRLSYSPSSNITADIPLLGYNGLFGDDPGSSDGRDVSLESSLTDTSFSYIVSDTTIRDIFRLPLQTAFLTTTLSDNKIFITLPDGYYGHLYLLLKLKSQPTTPELLCTFFGNTNTYVDNVLINSQNSHSNYNYEISLPHAWTHCNKIEISGDTLSLVSSYSVYEISLKTDKTTDFTQNGSLLQTKEPSAGYDRDGRIFAFFTDNSGNISLARSTDLARTWKYFYSITSKIDSDTCRFPFVVSDDKQNLCYIFYTLRNKLLCKVVNISYFSENDFNKISDNLKDYTTYGQNLKNYPSYVVSGLTTDTDFNNILSSQENGLKKYPIYWAYSTGLNIDVTDSSFSAYKNRNGALKAFILNTNSGTSYLLLKYSNDGGRTWFCDETEATKGLIIHKDGYTVDSTYVYYNESINSAILFYVYKNCFLSKIIQDDNTGKLLVEQSANFVDGEISGDIQKEIDEGLIRFPQSKNTEVLAVFGTNRSIPAQRPCAYSLPNGNIRILYKDNNGKLHAAQSLNQEWNIEEFYV